MPDAADSQAIRDAKSNAVTYGRYRSTKSIDDARLYVEALQQLIVLLPSQVSRLGVENVSFQLKRYEELIDRADRWISKREVEEDSATGGRIVYRRTLAPNSQYVDGDY